jgi:sugar O-acyltransferase (sialic acid O-acetyltransferase NeuD family)
VSKKSLLLLGAGGHARASIEVIEQAGECSVMGLLGLPEEVGGEVLGYPVIGTEAELTSLASRADGALVTVGQIKTPDVRRRLFALLHESGFATPVIVSPWAHVSPHAKIGAGTIIMHGAVVNAGAVVGKNCIINSLALVEHDAVVGDHCHIATKAAINGGVRVGEGSFIGSGALVRQCVNVGERCIIAMGERVTADCKAGSFVASGGRAK